MPTSVTAGEAFIKVSAKGVNSTMRSLQKLERMVVKGVGSMVRMASRLGVVMGAIAAGALVDFTRRAMNAQETWSKFSVVFGDRAAVMTRWVDKLSQQLGRSREEVAKMASESQDLFVPMGFSAEQAEKMSRLVTRLSLDLASFNNRSDEDAFRDITAAMTGSSETMKKYGSIVSATAVKQEALNMGLNPDSLTEAQKAWLRLKIMVETTRAAQGDLLRTQNSSVNIMKRLGAAYSQAATAIGTQLLPYVDWFAKILTHVVNSVGPVMAEWLQNSTSNMITFGENVKKTTLFILDMAKALTSAAEIASDMTTGLLAYEYESAQSKRSHAVQKFNEAKAGSEEEAYWKQRMEEAKDYEETVGNMYESATNLKDSAQRMNDFIDDARDNIENMSPEGVVAMAGQYQTTAPSMPSYDSLLPTMPSGIQANDELKKIEKHLAQMVASNEDAVFDNMQKEMADNNTVLRRIDDRLQAIYLKPPVAVEVR